jgi:hypothetical protein
MKPTGENTPLALPPALLAEVAAKAVIVAEVERLHWRIWNGKAKMPGKASTYSRGDISLPG